MNDNGRNDTHAGLAKAKDQTYDPSFISGYALDLSPTEKEILLIAKQMMKKHYLLDTGELNTQVTRQLNNETPDAISTAMRSLISKKILFDGASMTKDDVLVNDTRHRVYVIICSRPGIHFSAIRTMVDTDSRTLLFHLDMLKRFGFVRFAFINKNKAYYETSLPKEFDIIHYYLQNDNARHIFKAILENQSVSLDDLATILKDSMSMQVLMKRIKILVDHKLVSGKIEASKLISLNIPVRYKTVIKKQLSIS